MKVLKLLLTAFVALQLSSAFAAGEAPKFDATQALSELKSGNTRFVTSKMKFPHQTMGRVKETAKGQHPFAVVIACSDSRVAPEVIFDQGLGDIFVVRVAGNVLGDAEIGSTEYAVAHLNTPLVVVLGHGKCGAVTAVVEGDELTPSLKKSLKPVSAAKKTALGQEGDLITNTTKANVIKAVETLKNSKPVLKDKVDKGELKIVPAIYDVETGKVEFI